MESHALFDMIMGLKEINNNILKELKKLNKKLLEDKT